MSTAAPSPSCCSVSDPKAKRALRRWPNEERDGAADQHNDAEELEVILTKTEIAKAKKLMPSAPEGKTWKLVWHDEFDGTKLDESKWGVPDNRRRDGWWSPKAISLDGKGHLAISTLKDGDRYLDACVRTRGKFEHAHGYYVARIRLQDQPGHWSAFWLYNSCVGKIGNEGRDGMEIDIMRAPCALYCKS